MSKILFSLLFVCGVCAIERPVTRFLRGSSSSVTFNDPIPTQLLRQFQIKRFDVSMYIYERGEDNLCTKKLIYKILGDPIFPFPPIPTVPILPIDKGERLVVLIHGFNSNTDQQFPKDTAEVLCQRGTGTKVIVVDWRKLAFDDSLTKFENAVNYVPFVSGFLANLLVSMYKNGNFDPANTFLIGHSLGAYVAAYAARGFQKQTQIKIKRLTLLDPPLKLRIGTALNFNLSDAFYIDSVRTSFLTDAKRIGHVDFYMNPESRTQPTCEIGSALRFPLASRRRSGVVCSHSLAHIFFRESITTFTQFTGKKCPENKEGENDWAKCVCPTVYISMGYDWAWSESPGLNVDDVSGVYKVETNDQSPFAKDNCPNWGT